MEIINVFLFLAIMATMGVEVVHQHIVEAVSGILFVALGISIFYEFIAKYIYA